MITLRNFPQFSVSRHIYKAQIRHIDSALLILPLALLCAGIVMGAQ